MLTCIHCGKWITRKERADRLIWAWFWNGPSEIVPLVCSKDCADRYQATRRPIKVLPYEARR